MRRVAVRLRIGVDAVLRQLLPLRRLGGAAARDVPFLVGRDAAVIGEQGIARQVRAGEVDDLRFGVRAFAKGRGRHDEGPGLAVFADGLGRLPVTVGLLLAAIGGGAELQAQAAGDDARVIGRERQRLARRDDDAERLRLVRLPIFKVRRILVECQTAIVVLVPPPFASIDLRVAGLYDYALDKGGEIIHDHRHIGVVFSSVFGAVNASGSIFHVERQRMLAVRVEGFRRGGVLGKILQITPGRQCWRLVEDRRRASAGFREPDAVASSRSIRRVNQLMRR